MKIKVCGMRDAKNIQELAQLKPDFIGFIFYEKSPRNADQLDINLVNSLPESILKVGVFVNEQIEIMLEKAAIYGLKSLQLHGQENPEQCESLKKKGFVILKAFPIAEAADFKQTESYENTCNYFLFDTKTPQHGGSGQKFDWRLLEIYQGKTPFFLSGGIDLNDAEAIKAIKHPMFAGVDINSRFETEPGIKDIDKIKKIISQLA
jgi:phosphoribosylanthranilate isomerase